jgi:hypothetical protein
MRDGQEVKLYLRDEVSRDPRPLMEREGFRRICGTPPSGDGEPQGGAGAALVSRDGASHVAEPGRYLSMVGVSLDELESVVPEVTGR